MIYAGFWKRLAASIIDGVIIKIVISLYVILLSSVFHFSDGAFFTVWYVMLIPSYWLYYAIFESAKRQGTPGKIILRLKVTDIEGDRISFGRASGRHFGKSLSTLTFGIGFLMAAITQRKQALHDIMASCLVVGSEISKDDISVSSVRVRKKARTSEKSSRVRNYNREPNLEFDSESETESDSDSSSDSGSGGGGDSGGNGGNGE
ncbi:MAG: RDD family protein [Gemmatimonadota bacterium]|nr:RDD family protein [Gemmatimonadota bacterium]